MVYKHNILSARLSIHSHTVHIYVRTYMIFSHTFAQLSPLSKKWERLGGGVDSNASGPVGTTLGICLEVGGANPRKILSLTPAGPAHLSNQIMGVCVCV